MEKDSSSWISHVTALIEPQESVPMWKGIKAIQWDEIGSAIGNALDESACTISARNADWKREGQVLDGLGERPIATPIALSPLQSPLFWIMPVEDAKYLARVSQSSSETFVDPEIHKSFYRYLILEALDISTRLSIAGDLSPKLSEAHLPNEPAYCVDIEIGLGERTVWGRIVCPQSFHTDYSAHVRSAPKPPINLENAREIPLSLSLRVGHVDLSYEEFKQVGVGDFIVLDHCTYSPKKHKGSAELSLGETPIFMLKVKEGKLKIFDYLTTTQQETTMDEFEAEPEEAFEENFEEDEEQEIALSTEEPEELLNPKTVPLTIHVEVAKLKMSLEELLQLKPGNALALSVKPHEGVNLVLNGKVVGKGQLYQMGETLGVKVTQTT